MLATRSPYSCHSERGTARLMDPSLATTRNLLGLRFPPPSGPNLLLGRDTPSPPLSPSASSVPQSPAKRSSTSPATAKRSARSSCAETSSCRATSKTPMRRLAHSTVDTSTLETWPCGTRTGRCRCRTGRKISSSLAERYADNSRPSSVPSLASLIPSRMRRRSR